MPPKPYEAREEATAMKNLRTLMAPAFVAAAVLLGVAPARAGC
jgi:hypothetical protein